ncbi:MAG TPA: hypothetical protein VH497_20100 [Vicinamibacterales bacterium]
MNSQLKRRLANPAEAVRQIAISCVVSVPVVTCLVLLMSGPAVLAQPKPAWRLDFARNLLEAAFPELVGSETKTLITLDAPFNYEWLEPYRIHIRVFAPQRSLARDDSNDSRDWYVNANFFFNRFQLDHAQFDGERVKSRAMEELTSQLQQHPEWTDSQMAVALDEAGAKYGPNHREAFLKDLRLERFSGALGRISSEEVRFVWRLGNADLGADDILSPGWMIKGRVADSSQQHRCIGMWLEPIGGSPIIIATHAC